MPVLDEIAPPEMIHEWFGLTYANYLVLHRTLLQSMPDEWQVRFVACLEELEDAFEHVDKASSYSVQCRGERGRIVRDPVPHYNRGRTRIAPRIPEGTRGG